MLEAPGNIYAVISLHFADALRFRVAFDIFDHHQQIFLTYTSKVMTVASRPQLLLIVNQVLGNKQRPSLSSLRAEDRLREDLGLDSLDLAELTVRIEDAFSVDVFADGLVRTIGEIEAKLAIGIKTG